MEEYLQLNAIQHFAFCKRQWALINLEQVWSENEDTTLGQYVHQNVDDMYFDEKRSDRVIIRSLPIFSNKLKLNGISDLVEFKKSKNGIPIFNYEGLWTPYVVEYKKGKPKGNKCDIYQLVAEVMCIEEMMNVKIEKSALYYKTTNKRLIVEITDNLRNEVVDMCAEMHNLMKNKITPKAEIEKNCKRCSLYDICVPRLTHHKKSVINYINRYLEE